MMNDGLFIVNKHIIFYVLYLIVKLFDIPKTVDNG